MVIKKKEEEDRLLLLLLIPDRQCIFYFLYPTWNAIEKEYSRKFLRLCEDIKGLLKTRWKGLGVVRKEEDKRGRDVFLH